MRALVALCLFAVAVSASTNVLNHLSQAHQGDAELSGFLKFALRFQRNYGSVAEADHRFLNFKATVARNVQLNKENPKARFGINKFADLSAEEFRRSYLMPINSTGKMTHIPKFYKHKVDIPAVRLQKSCLPTGVDWVAKGATTAVKNQGQCGSCWAFSATQALESATFLAGQGLPVLSPEQIVDCDSSDGGCQGGDPRSALTYVAGAGGQDTEGSYPYTAGGGQSGQCAFQQSNVAATEGGPQDVGDGNEGSLQSFLQNSGPPSVCVDASSWSSYEGGVLTSCGCNIDHAVQAVGISDDGSYYIVRNSWDVTWGEGGYIWLATGQNTCCVANEVTWVSGASAAKKHKH